MAIILPFVSGGRSRKLPAGERMVAGSGEIVIFTGVRVEYGTPPPAPAAKPRSRRRRTPAKEAALVV